MITHRIWTWNNWKMECAKNKTIERMSKLIMKIFSKYYTSGIQMMMVSKCDDA